jgi:hypothetical protein
MKNHPFFVLEIANRTMRFYKEHRLIAYLEKHWGEPVRDILYVVHSTKFCWGWKQGKVKKTKNGYRIKLEKFTRAADFIPADHPKKCNK